jgi:hypothetical protein
VPGEVCTVVPASGSRDSGRDRGSSAQKKNSAVAPPGLERQPPHTLPIDLGMNHIVSGLGSSDHAAEVNPQVIIGE